MPSGTTINNVQAPRIHRNNAEDVIEREEESIKYNKQWLIAMAFISPANSKDAVIETLDSISEIVENIQESAVRSFLANQVVDFPADCVDDYDD